MDRETVGNNHDSAPLMTVDEVAAHLKIEPGTIRQWVKLGRIPHVKLGNKVTRFRRSDVDAWVLARANGVTEGAAA